ncbi:hypothetical protein ACJRO7_018443 [Eucalyptus globulus]|uniref:Transmembrane protein n=1 Tax=Eucalyptus globulus TaxID=34317 RepID=A0ABD3L4R5_EUCGL
MGSRFPLNFLLLVLALASPQTVLAQEIKLPHVLDLLIRDYTFKSSSQQIKTGVIHAVNLPKNLSGIRVDTVKFRCGSLRRYGAQVKEFHLGIGVTVQPCVERVMLIRQILQNNWSSIYYSNYDLSGYQLVSPVLGLLAYNAGSHGNSNPATAAFELGITAGEKPITVNFTGVATLDHRPGVVPMCANFESNGKLTLANQVAPSVCLATRQGHFGLVTELPPVQMRKQVSKWKVAVGGSIGSMLGVFLLSLLFVALFVKAKKKSRREEMERRAYEEEALQVSMVGHVRAPTASVTRTVPIIEHEYAPFPT